MPVERREVDQASQACGWTCPGCQFTYWGLWAAQSFTADKPLCSTTDGISRARLSVLMDQGLIHKVDRLSAFIGCTAGCARAPHEVRHHAAQFLICRGCRQVVELRNQDVSMVFARAAKAVGFSVSDVAIEVEGLCYTCKNAAAMAQRSNV